MSVLGLTGNFGSGKTTVLKLLEEAGAHGFNCDEKIHQYYKNKKSTVYKQVIAAFPKSVEKGEINRRFLGKEVFFDQDKLATLEGIIHPVIKQDLFAWMDKVNKKDGIYVAEVPLLFEERLDSRFDKTILVLTSIGKTIERITKAHNLTKEEVLYRLALYMPISGKIEKSDFIVNNDLGIKELKKEVNLLWKKLK